MCSWCWGISEVIEQLRNRYQSQMRFKLVLGGLRPGETEPLNDNQVAFLDNRWREVAAATGQPFNHSILQNRSFVYDTEPPSRAVRTADALQPGIAFPFFQAIQEAFYVHNKDTNNWQTYVDLCPQFGIQTSEFLPMYLSGGMFAATQEDFRLAVRLGVTSFPSVLMRIGKEYDQISMGYASFQDLCHEIDLLLPAKAI